MMMHKCLLLGFMLFVYAGCNFGEDKRPVYPVDNNAINTIIFKQPAMYTDNTPMSSVPTLEIGGYYLYICHVSEANPNGMVWIAEINNPLQWEKDEWIGRWNIQNIVNDNTNEAAFGVVPDGVHAFALRAISTRIDPATNKPYQSEIGVPWIYADPPVQLAGVIPIEGDIYAPAHVKDAVGMQFDISGDNK